jgi:3-(3-hydroxy-phenyl)propionate hydroxylase
LNTPDAKDDVFSCSMIPGAVSADAPVKVGGKDEWFLNQIATGEFTGLYFCGIGDDVAATAGQLAALARLPIAVRPVIVIPRGGSACVVSDALVVEDVEGILAHRFDARPGTFCLLRPDQHVCARWRELKIDSISAALGRAACTG